MKHIKALNKLTNQIYDLISEPSGYLKTDDDGKEERILIYPDHFPFSLEVFFITLDAIYQKTGEKNRFLTLIYKYADDLIFNVDLEKHNLTSDDFDRIIVDRKRQDPKDWWILWVFDFGEELLSWVEEKEEVMLTEQENNPNLSSNGDILEQFNTNPTEEQLKNELSNLIKAPFLTMFVKKVIKWRDEYNEYASYDNKLVLKSYHAAFYLLIFEIYGTYFKQHNGGKQFFTSIRTSFDFIFCSDTKNYKQNDLEKEKKYFMDQHFWITLIGKA